MHLLPRPLSCAKMSCAKSQQQSWLWWRCRGTFLHPTTSASHAPPWIQIFSPDNPPTAHHCSPSFLCCSPVVAAVGSSSGFTQELKARPLSSGTSREQMQPQRQGCAISTGITAKPAAESPELGEAQWHSWNKTQRWL